MKRKTTLKRIKAFFGTLGMGVLATTLAGCFIVSGPPPAQPERPKVEITDPDPSYVEGGSASDNKDFFIFTLQNFSDSEDEFTGKNITASLINNGFEAADMQVSFDETKSDLLADTITVSTRFGEECLLGQLERRTRELFVYQADAVGPDKDICLIGNTAEISVP